MRQLVELERRLLHALLLFAPLFVSTRSRSGLGFAVQEAGLRKQRVYVFVARKAKGTRGKEGREVRTVRGLLAAHRRYW